MREIFVPNLNMGKAGAHLLDIQDGKIGQQELDLDQPEIDRSTLMMALDQLNSRFGRGTVSMASGGNQGKRRQWVMRQELRTPDYTTCWKSMAIARA